MLRLFSAGVTATLLSCGFSSTAEGEPVWNDPNQVSSSSLLTQSSSSELSAVASSSSAAASAFLPENYWIAVPAGEFERGTVDIEVSAFTMAATEVTQGLYRNVLGEMPTQFAQNDSLPVTHVTWYDAARFCNALSKLLGLDTLYSYTKVGVGGVLLDVNLRTGVTGVSLPSEAQWEYAYRAGTSTDYFWSNSVEAAQVLLYVELFESGRTLGPQKIAQRLSNAWGFYDMAGNVWEWLNDWYALYDPNAIQNPTGPLDGSERATRGGGWTSSLVDMQATSRFKRLPDESHEAQGFRVVLVGHGN